MVYWVLNLVFIYLSFGSFLSTWCEISALYAYEFQSLYTTKQKKKGRAPLKHIIRGKSWRPSDSIFCIGSSPTRLRGCCLYQNARGADDIASARVVMWSIYLPLDATCQTTWTNRWWELDFNEISFGRLVPSSSKIYTPQSVVLLCDMYPSDTIQLFTAWRTCRKNIKLTVL